MRYSGPLGKGYRGDKQGAMRYQGAARKLVGSLIDRLHSTPFNGSGQMVGHQRLGDVVLYASVMLTGAAPIIRTWIETVSSSGGGELFYSLLYATFNPNPDKLRLEIYRVSVLPATWAGHNGWMPFFVYDTDKLDGYIFTPDMDSVTTGVQITGANWWVGTDPATKKTHILSVYENKVFVDGHILYEDSNADTIISAAALEFKRRPFIAHPKLLGYCPGVHYWVSESNYGYAVPSLFSFAPDASEFNVLAFSGMLYGGYTDSNPRTEFNGSLQNYILKDKDGEMIRGRVYDAATVDATELVEQVSYSNNPLSGSYRYKLFAQAIPVARSDEQDVIGNYDYIAQTLDIIYTYSIADGRVYIKLSFFAYGQEFVCSLYDYQYCGTGDCAHSPISTILDGHAIDTTFKVALVPFLTVMRLSEQTRTEEGTAFDNHIRVYYGANEIASETAISPLVDTEWKLTPLGDYSNLFGSREEVTERVFRPLLQSLFNIPFAGVWTQSLSPQLPVAIPFSSEEQVRYYVVAPYKYGYWDQTVYRAYATTFSDAAQTLEIDNYVAGYFTDNKHTFKTQDLKPGTTNA